MDARTTVVYLRRFIATKSKHVTRLTVCFLLIAGEGYDALAVTLLRRSSVHR